jgi:hypothetical protein
MCLDFTHLIWQRVHQQRYEVLIIIYIVGAGCSVLLRQWSSSSAGLLSAVAYAQAASAQAAAYSTVRTGEAAQVHIQQQQTVHQHFGSGRGSNTNINQLASLRTN